MTYGCPICQETLEKPPNEEVENNRGGALISAAPCGHVFHRVCISTWLKGTATNNQQCPCCRKPIPKLICIPLFPTIQDESILDDSMSRIPCNHEPELQELRKMKVKLENEVSKWKQINQATTEDLERMKSKCLAEERKSQTYIEKYQITKSKLSYQGELEKKLDKVENELKCLQAIRDALEAVKSDSELKAEEINWPVNQASIDNLLAMKLTLTRELRSQILLVKNSAADKERIRMDNTRIRAELRNLKQKNEEISNENEFLKIEVEDLKKQLSCKADDSVVYLTPTRKRKSGSTLHPKSYAQSQDESVFELSTSSVEVDHECEILEPFHNRGTNGVVPNRNKKTALRTEGVKSTNDLLESKQEEPSSSSSTATNLNDKKVPSQLSSRKRYKLLGAPKSADDIALNVGKASSSSSSSGISKKPASQNEMYSSKATASNYGDLSPMDYNANIKSSLPGLAGTPISKATSIRMNTVLGRGIKRPPKIIKK